MKVLTNQTIYQCSHCGKKNLSKKGSEIHENQYCKNHNSPHIKGILTKRDKCKHVNTEIEWSTIPGEVVKQPECYVCLDCGKRF